jgi:hypothetical protein
LKHTSQHWERKATFDLHSKNVEVTGLDENKEYKFRAVVEENDGNITYDDIPEVYLKTPHCIQNGNSKKHEHE